MKKKRNKNALFLLPIYERSEKFYGKHFENAYIDKNKQNEIKFVFQNRPRQEIMDFFMENKYLISFTDNENEIILTLQIPKEYESEIKLYKQGKYSKLSKDFKERIIALNPGYSFDLNIILYPSEDDIESLSERLGASLPKDSEVFDIIGDEEYYEFKK